MRRWERGEMWLLVFSFGFIGVVSAAMWAQDFPLTDPVTWSVLLDGLGVWKHLGFIAVQAGQVIIPFIPGQATGVASGYLFGAVLGLTYTMIGTVAGSLVAFFVARRFGRDVVVRLVDPDVVERWDSRVDRYGVPVFFAMILLPGFPDDVLCFLAGLSNMRFDGYVVSVVLGRLPLFALYAYAGSHPGRLWSTPGLVLTGVVAGVSLACFVYRETLFSALTARLSRE